MIDKNIIVNHEYSRDIPINDSDRIVDEKGLIIREATKESEYLIRSKNPLFIEPGLDSIYILFLKKDIYSPCYYGAIEPFAIKIVNGVAELQSNLTTQNAKIEPEIFLVGNKRVYIDNAVSQQISDQITGINVTNLLEQIAKAL